jgi:ribosome-associated protein
MTSDNKLLKLIIEELSLNKAENIISINLKNKSPIADFMIIASGRSQRHVLALGEKILQRAKESKLTKYLIEGQKSGEWILIDIGDIIIHLFKPEIRKHYNLEKLWSGELPSLTEEI